MNETLFVTATGLQIDIAKIKSDDIRIYDIAWSLHNINRYLGHTPVAWDVLSHIGLTYSLYVNDVRGKVDPLFSLALLLHDAAEAYAGDMIWPLKQLREAQQFLVFETNIKSIIMKRFNINELSNDIDWKEIDYYDRLAAYIELDNLFPFFKDKFKSKKGFRKIQLVKAKISDFIETVKHLSINNNVLDIDDLYICPDFLKEYITQGISQIEYNTKFEVNDTKDIERLQL